MSGGASRSRWMDRSEPVNPPPMTAIDAPAVAVLPFVYLSYREYVQNAQVNENLWVLKA